jgi:hypothetical protein
MAERDKPCCAAEAMRRIKHVDVGGIVVGLTMLEDICLDVQDMNLSTREKIADELMKRIKIYNYIPEPAYKNYRDAVLREYEMMNKKGE